ncbi:MAG: S8 family peptidase [Pseudomonadales bacterium]|nr:S8 family peptidase [Pseudomonadales bacterium]
MTQLATTVLFICLIFIAGCDSNNQNDNNAAGIAVDAGSDQEVAASSQVTLAASVKNSTSVSLQYAWQQIAGVTVDLYASTNKHIEFIAPKGSDLKPLKFMVEVSEDNAVVARDTVTITVVKTLAGFNISGSISVSSTLAVDSDVNDPNANYISNDAIAAAQTLSVPITLAGYVNKANAGTEGRSKSSGDLDDFFVVDLTAGQTIELTILHADEADLDLYLYNNSGEVIDASLEISALESLSVKADGQYFIGVNVFKGASNYRLDIGYSGSGNQSKKLSLQLSNDFIQSQAIAEYQDDVDGFSARSAASKTRLNVKEGIQTAGFKIVKENARGQLHLDLQEEKVTRSVRNKIKKLIFFDANDKKKYLTLMAIKNLRSSHNLKYIEPNFIRHSLLGSNDPYFNRQWNYPLIRLPEAWNITTGNASVTVAVLDSGVRKNHPDLQGQLLNGFDFISNLDYSHDGDGIDSDVNDPGDTDTGNSIFHGTFVAGIIAAKRDNGYGIAGIASGVQLMPLRVLGFGGIGNSYDINQAMLYAAGLDNDSGLIANPAADIINLSLGGPGYSQADKNIIDQVRAAGVIVIASAGNHGDATLSYPAAYDGVISVAALDAKGERASYSAIGNSIDIAAPGGEAKFDDNRDGYPDAILSTFANDSSSSISYTIDYLQGTSVASPHVAAVIALMKTVNPNLSPEDIDAMLDQGLLSDDIGDAGRDDLYGMGMINAFKAVSAALNTGTVNTTPVLEFSASKLDFSLLSSLPLTVESSVQYTLSVESIESSESWLNIVELAVDVRGLGQYQFRVDRSGLEDGEYTGNITFISNDVEVIIAVTMRVDSQAEIHDVGTVYILLLDAKTDQAYDQVMASFDGEFYHYSFSSVIAGQYKMIACSDYDNDFEFCDSGEVFGMYMGDEDEQEVSIKNDLQAIDFNIKLIDSGITLMNNYFYTR